MHVRRHFRRVVVPRTRFQVVVAHRRAGKTVAAVQRLILSAITCDHAAPRVAYIAPTYGQAKRAAWDYARKFAAPHLVRPPHESELRLELINGARLALYGADRPDTLRGQYFDDVVLDECADMSPEVWPAVVRPTLSDRRGRALFLGTPRGFDAFHELFEAAQRLPDWEAIVLRASESGYLAADELEAARRELPPEVYEQEYECSFEAAARAGYFRRDWIREGEPPPNTRLRIIGASDYAVTADGGDWTVHVVCGLDDDGRVWVLDVWRAQTDSAAWIEAMCDLAARWNVHEWIEETGQIRGGVGPFIEARVRARGLRLFRRAIAPKTDKATRAQAIRARAASDGLWMPKGAAWAPALVAELLAFPSGKHDDQVDALSLVGLALTEPAAMRREAREMPAWLAGGWS